MNILRRLWLDAKELRNEGRIKHELEGRILIPDQTNDVKLIRERDVEKVARQIKAIFNANIGAPVEEYTHLFHKPDWSKNPDKFIFKNIEILPQYKTMRIAFGPLRPNDNDTGLFLDQERLPAFAIVKNQAGTTGGLYLSISENLANPLTNRMEKLYLF